MRTGVFLLPRIPQFCSAAMFFGRCLATQLSVSQQHHPLPWKPKQRKEKQVNDDSAQGPRGREDDSSDIGHFRLHIDRRTEGNQCPWFCLKPACSEHCHSDAVHKQRHKTFASMAFDVSFSFFHFAIFHFRDSPSTTAKKRAHHTPQPKAETKFRAARRRRASIPFSTAISGRSSTSQHNTK